MIAQNNFSPSTNKTSVKHLAYWQSQLHTFIPWLDFPYDRSNSDVYTQELSLADRTRSFKQTDLILAPKLVQNLQKIAKQNKVDLEVIFLSAYYILLYRYSDRADLIIGYLPQLMEGSLSVIPLGIKTGETSPSCLDLCHSLRDLMASARVNQNPDLERLTSWMQSLWEQNKLPWEQMLFRYRQDRITPIAPLPKHTELLLDIDLLSSRASVKFNTALFLSATGDRLIANYHQLLSEIAQNPQKTIDKLSLLNPAEADLVLSQGEKTQTELESRSILQLFVSRVAENPQWFALRCQEQSITYEELNQRANQLARHLQNLGVGKHSLVGLCLERSLDLVVGVLGILKTGAGYVPLDRENPPSRLAYILQDSQVKVLLTQTSLQEQLPELSSDLSLVLLDGDRDLIAQQSSEEVEVDITPEDIAHIVYTSGSTGKPKGVMVSHGNLSHYAHSLQIALNITTDDVYLHRGSIALIVSARQLLMPLAQGATVSILTTEDKKDPLKMFEWIKQHGVTIVDRVPSFWRNFAGILDSLSQEHRRSLMDNRVRLVAAGGEQVSIEIYRCWRELFKPEVQLANIYGQTEGTGVVTIYYIPETISDRFKSLPVGSPIPNMRVYVLDRHLQPVPIGVTGEIHISGAGVAKGYLNREELTAEKFIANPFIPGARLYKTGDLGRFLPDGTIQFLGRSDRQVNINGLRIELGEIEANLVQHPQILQAAVVVKENKLGETLTAYLIANQTPPSSKEVRNFLGEKLPKYMLPSNYTFCDSFPLTASGKIDRQALVAYYEGDPDAEYVPPSNELEAAIVATLQEILGIERVSTQADFIDLGGNSLIAARLVTEIEAKYSQTIPIASVFQASTPQALAQLIAEAREKALPESLVPIKSGKQKPILFGIHNLGYGLELYRPLAKHLTDDISLYGLSSFFSNESHTPHPRDIAGLATYYCQQIQKVQPQGPYHIMGVSFGGAIAYETACKLLNQGHKVEFLGLIDTFIPDNNSIYKVLPLKDRVLGHWRKIRTKGINHIWERILWRIDATMDEFRSYLYQIDWIKNNLVDLTSRNFSQAEYLQQRREHEAVNHNYRIHPYPGKVNMFRASDDLDPKLEWQELAQAGLSIYDVPGEHLEVLQEPNVRILATKLQSVLLQKG